MKQLADGLRAYIFNQNTGFGLLYVVVKLPVSVVTFCATITLLAFIFGGFVPAVLHIMCNTNKYKICSSMLTSGEWYAWFVITIEGNTICAIISVLLFTPCVYLLYTVTKLARDAIAVIGDDRDSSFS
jgi:Fe2+ transport system protein B